MYNIKILMGEMYSVLMEWIDDIDCVWLTFVAVTNSYTN